MVCVWLSLCLGVSMTSHLYIPIHLYAPCMFVCPIHPPYGCMTPHIYTPQISALIHPYTPCMYAPMHPPICLYGPYICTPPYFCMPPGSLYAPIHPPYVCMAPYICTPPNICTSPYICVPPYICMLLYMFMHPHTSPVCLYAPYVCSPNVQHNKCLRKFLRFIAVLHISETKSSNIVDIQFFVDLVVHTSVAVPVQRYRLEVQPQFLQKHQRDILESNFPITESIFFMEYKLLPIQLIWLYLVYGKMFSLARHQVLMVSEEKYSS